MIEALEGRVASLEELHDDTRETAYEALNKAEHWQEEEGVSEWNQPHDENSDDITIVIKRQNFELLVMLIVAWILAKYSKDPPDQDSPNPGPSNDNKPVTDA